MTGAAVVSPPSVLNTCREYDPDPIDFTLIVKASRVATDVAVVPTTDKNTLLVACTYVFVTTNSCPAPAAIIPDMVIFPFVPEQVTAVLLLVVCVTFTSGVTYMSWTPAPLAITSDPATLAVPLPIIMELSACATAFRPTAIVFCPTASAPSPS